MIELSEDDLLYILRSALFRDSWISRSDLPRDLMDKLSPEAGFQVEKWLEEAP